MSLENTKSLWTSGDKNNPVPNSINSGISHNDERKSINRAQILRRDVDEQKNFTVNLLDIDTVIIEHLNRIQLTVVDEGNRIKVPIFYSSPEKWVSIQRDGIIRDTGGMIILPAIVIKRTSSETDQTMKMFNRYLNYTVVKKYSAKNQYTQFNLLSGKNVPVNDVYDVVMPDHMVFTYHFIIWTEYVIQMNELVERIKFETDEYWGDPQRFKFRTKIDSFSHAIELQVDQDRVVKTEFDLVVNGYILPDRMTKNGINQSTTRKWMTPKKVVIGIETVPTDYDFNQLDIYSEKWRSQVYPNLKKGDEPLTPPINFNPDIDFLKLIQPVPFVPIIPPPSIQWHLPAPIYSSDIGESGWQSYDNNYYYIYTNMWKRVPMSLFDEAIPPGNPSAGEGVSLYSGEYFYIFINGNWKRVLIVHFNAYVLF